jgi:hypothetical protein
MHGRCFSPALRRGCFGSCLQSPAKEGLFAAWPRQNQERAKGLEPSTSSLGIGRAVVLSAAPAALTASPAGRCTTGCTESPDRLDIVARAVALVASMPLSDADRSAVLDRVIEDMTRGQRRTGGYLP